MSYEISTIMPAKASVKANISNKTKKLSAILTKLSSAFSACKFNNEALLGVEITPSCIYVCQIDNKTGDRVLTGLASVCMAGKFVGEDILNNPKLYSENLKRLVRENKITTKKVAISLPVSSSIVKIATISKMNDADIARAIKYGSLWQNLMSQDDSPDNYSIFYQVIRRDDAYETMDILLVATRLADIKLYKDIIIKSGLKPVIIDAKSIALHYALKNRVGNKQGTMLIEFGLDDNYIMVMGDSRPRIFPIKISEQERSAILGHNATNDALTVTALIKKYSDKLNAIIDFYNKRQDSLDFPEIYVMSSLPVVSNFISGLDVAVKNSQVKECSMFDYLIIPDNFTISKSSAKNNISSWAGAISMAIFPWRVCKEEWIEINKSPAFGTIYRQHSSKVLSQLSVKIGDFAFPNQFTTQTKPSFARPAFAANIMALAAAVFSIFIIYKSHQSLLLESQQLAADNFSDEIIAQYNEKTQILANMQNIIQQLDAIGVSAATIAAQQNQQYVLSMYSYLDTILQQGVWLKQLTFTAPNDIEIEGRSLDDGGVVSLLGTVSGSKMFSKMALKHIQTIKELDLYAQNSSDLKSFIFKGNLAETLPGEYLNKPNLVAGGMLHGG